MRARSPETDVRRLRQQLRYALAVLNHVRVHGVATDWDRRLVGNQIRDMERELAPKRPRRRRTR